MLLVLGGILGGLWAYNKSKNSVAAEDVSAPTDSGVKDAYQTTQALPPWDSIRAQGPTGPDDLPKPFMTDPYPGSAPSASINTVSISDSNPSVAPVGFKLIEPSYFEPQASTMDKDKNTPIVEEDYRYPENTREQDARDEDERRKNEQENQTREHKGRTR